jgi:ribonuclease HII
MIIAGIDEVGRGPLVGDVVAAAVILPDQHNISGIKDSKKLSEKRREELFKQICEQAVAWHIASATPQEIDALNILQATFLAMQRAVAGLKVQPNKVLVDGNLCPKLPYPVAGVIQGDNLIEQIAAASILAKVYRDRQLVELDKKYPEYGFARHKGYATQEHLDALEIFGPTREHRQSFAPVARLLFMNN